MYWSMVEFSHRGSSSRVRSCVWFSILAPPPWSYSAFQNRYCSHKTEGLSWPLSASLLDILPRHPPWLLGWRSHSRVNFPVGRTAPALGVSPEPGQLVRVGSPSPPRVLGLGHRPSLLAANAPCPSQPSLRPENFKDKKMTAIISSRVSVTSLALSALQAAVV